MMAQFQRLRLHRVSAFHEWWYPRGVGIGSIILVSGFRDRMAVSVERYQTACPDDPRSSWKCAKFQKRSGICQQTRYFRMRVREQVNHIFKEEGHKIC